MGDVVREVVGDVVREIVGDVVREIIEDVVREGCSSNTHKQVASSSVHATLGFGGIKASRTES